METPGSQVEEPLLRHVFTEVQQEQKIDIANDKDRNSLIETGLKEGTAGKSKTLGEESYELINSSSGNTSHYQQSPVAAKNHPTSSGTWFEDDDKDAAQRSHRNFTQARRSAIEGNALTPLESPNWATNCSFDDTTASAQERAASSIGLAGGEEWDNIAKAACLVEQAMLGRWMPLEVIENEDYQTARHAFTLYHYLDFLRHGIIFVFFLLPFFEVPLWCEGDLPLPCGDPDVVPLSGLPYLPHKTVLVIEGSGLSLLAGLQYLQWLYLGKTAFWHNKVAVYKTVLVAGGAVDRLMALTVVLGLLPSHPLHIFPYWRVLLAVIYSRALRGCFRILLRILASFLDVAVLLAAFILFSSWLAYILFQDTPQGKTVFVDFWTTLMQMFILLTTANSPGSWIPAFTAYRPAFFFFFLYLSLGLFFFMNLMLSVVYSSYKFQMAARTEKKVTARQSSLRAAFSLLDGTQRGWVPPVTMSALFQAMDHLRASEAAETRNESPSASPRLGWLKWVVSWLQLTLEPR